MCDIIVALPRATADKTLLFGKNSDRERREAQAVESFPAAEHADDSQVNCTYIAIPQVRRTHAVLLCRPFWLWGAEMGANEHGLVIGNEGVHARAAPQRENALLGMDLVRLALERASTAIEALELITGLLERYGQGGNCSQLQESFYNNSFIIADPKDAYVLETLGRNWLVEQVGDVRAISNAYSIGTDAARVSSALTSLIHESGWSSDPVPDYANAIADRELDLSGRTRWARATSLLQERMGELTVADMAEILRDHGPDQGANANWPPSHSMTPTICAHATDLKPRGQTVGSLVTELSKSQAVHWVTGSAAPCISIFKPLFVDVPVPATGPKPTGRSDLKAFWWRHERLHKAILREGMDLNAVYAERDALEAEFYQRIAAVSNGGDRDERARTVLDCWRDAMALEDRWLARIEASAEAHFEMNDD